MTMNSHERFKAFAAREPMDRPLRRAMFSAGLRARLVEAAETDDLVAHYRMDDYGNIVLGEPEEYMPPDFSRYYSDLPEGTVINEIGVAISRNSQFQFAEFTSPLRNAKSIEQLQEFPVEDFSGWDADYMAAEVNKRHEQGCIAAAAVKGIYEGAWQVRGYEQFLMDMLTQPDWCNVLLDKFARRNMNMAVAAARSGVDVMRCGENIASQTGFIFDIGLWREFVKSRWAPIWKKCREIKPDIQIYYHSDGNITQAIDDLIEAGVTLLNPVQPECMDLVSLAEHYRGRLLFDGGIGIQHLMPFGSPDEVRSCVFERVAQFGQDMFLAPTHFLGPEVPVENVDAFFCACDEVSFDKALGKSVRVK